MAYELEIKIGDIEYEIKGDTPEGVLEIARGIGFTEGPSHAEERGERFVTINSPSELQVGDEVKSTVEAAGGFGSVWRQRGKVGLVTKKDADEGFWIRNSEDDEYLDLFFLNSEVCSQFVKKVE